MQKDHTLLIIGLIVVLFVALAIWKGHRRRELPPTATSTEKLAEICHASEAIRRLAEIGLKAKKT